MIKQIKISNVLATAALLLTFASCALTEKTFLREPAQVSDAQKFQSPNLKSDVDKAELMWLEVKTPADKVVFADAKIESMYQAFRKTFGLDNTLEVRNRFSLLPIKPFSAGELNFLENSEYYKAQIVAAKNKQKQAVTTQKQAVTTQKQRKNLFKRSQNKVAANPQNKIPVKTTRVAISPGKPSYVETTYWIAADVATVLQNQFQLPFEDVVLYFKTFGFRTLSTGKKVHISDLYLRYKEYGSTGMDYVQLTDAEIERIRKFSGIVIVERSKILVDLIKNGESIEQYEKTLLANGFSIEQINEAKDRNNSTYAAAYQQGDQYKNLVTNYSNTLPSSLAQIQAQKDMQYINDAEYSKKYSEEKAAVDKYLADTKNSWSAGIANVVNNFIDVTKVNLTNTASVASSLIAVNQGGTWVTPTMINPSFTDTRDAYAKGSLDEKIKTYGSLTKYYQFLVDVEKKYQFRPLARPLEFAANFYKAIPNTVANVVGYIDVLREISPIPLSTVDMYYYITNQPFSAKDGNFTAASNAITSFVEELKPENTDFREEFMVTVAPKVLGQMVVQLGAGWLSGGALIPTMMGVAAGGTEAYNDASRAGASDQHRRTAATVGSLTGLLDAIPMTKFLKPLSQAEKIGFFKIMWGTIFKAAEKKVGSAAALQITKSVMARQMMQYGGKILGGIVAEGGTEVAQNKINDLAKSMTYDPKSNALVINEKDMIAFYGGALGGAFGGTFEIALEGQKHNIADSAIEAQVSQITGIFPMMTMDSVVDTTKVAATGNSNGKTNLDVQIENYEAQVKNNEKSNRTDQDFLDYKKTIIQKRDALVKQKASQTNSSAQTNTNTQVNGKTNVSTQTTGAATEVEATLQKEQIGQEVITELKKSENKEILENLKNPEQRAAFVELMKGKSKNWKNFLEFLAPKESVRRKFFNQMIQKIAAAKIWFTRKQMIENTERVLNEPNCSL